ncbi:MAG: DUF4832 domain-containing protein [Paludibacteraceae bacterium]|nr:DUF4832 domain-containing protein [Paludibacteraceae bacterium]
MKKNILTGFILFFSTLCWAQSVVISRTIDKVQPMTGLVLWNDQAESRKGTLGTCFALEYTYCPPCKVVTGKSNGKIQYDWTFIENILNGVKSRGHQAILRFYYEYPGSRMGCDNTRGATGVPDYIKALSGYTETYKSTEDGACYYADWSNSELQWFVKQFITDFAAKYDHDPRIAFLEVGFGHWGEYHIYGGPSLDLGHNFPSKAFQKSFLQHIDTTLHVLPWSISIDASVKRYAPITEDQSLMALHFGLFDDSFMHAEHDKSQGEGYNEDCWNALGKNRWQQGACGGEISYYEDSDQKNFLNPAGMYGVTWEQASAKYHISFMICNDAPSGKYATATRFKEGSMACGYRFRLTECSVRGNQTAVTFTNEGIAPIYKDAYPTIGTTRSATSLKGLLPGQSRTCMIDAVLTRADDLTITSDYILPSQQIQFNADAVLTDLSAVPMAEPLAAKVLYQGQLLIRHHGIYHTALGQPLF